MKIISITSGKGGVGKTTLTCQMALALAQQDKKVLILDGDLGLCNIDIHFGVRPLKGLSELLKGQPIRDCLTPLVRNIDLLAGVSGALEHTQLNSFQRREVIQQMNDLQYLYDYALIDTSSGIYEHVLHLNAVADEVVVVLTPDPTSIADGYALIKLLHQKYRLQNFNIVCNQLRSQTGENLFVRFSEVVEKFLSVRLKFLGQVPFDESLLKAQQAQRLIVKQSQSLNSQITINQQIQKMILELSLNDGINSYTQLNEAYTQSGAIQRTALQKNKGLEALLKPASGQA